MTSCFDPRCPQRGVELPDDVYLCPECGLALYVKAIGDPIVPRRVTDLERERDSAAWDERARTAATGGEALTADRREED